MAALNKAQLVQELEVLRKLNTTKDAQIAALQSRTEDLLSRICELEGQLLNVTEVASAVNSSRRGADPAWAARVAQRKAVMEAARAQAMNSNHMVVV
jgi:cell division protein FtsB